MCSFAGGILQRATGTKLESDLDELYEQTGELQMMSAIITASHGLPCKSIIHCHPPGLFTSYCYISYRRSFNRTNRDLISRQRILLRFSVAFLKKRGL